MKNILIPTDFSDTAVNALLFAVKMFKHTHCNLYLFNGIETPISKSTMFISHKDDLAQESLGLLEREKEKFLSELKGGEMSIKLISKTGALGHLVDQIITEYSIDMVIMGTEKIKGIEDVLLGSKTYNIIQEIDIPVLIIPEGLQYSSFSNFIFAADLEKINDKVSLKPLNELLQMFKSKLEIITVNEKGKEKMIDDLIERIKLKNYFKQFKPVFKTIINDDIVDGINGHLKDKSHSMLVMLSRKNGFFDVMFNSSVTKKISNHSHFPTLVLQDKM